MSDDVGAAAVKSVEHGVIVHRVQRAATAVGAGLSDVGEAWLGG